MLLALVLGILLAQPGPTPPPTPPPLSAASPTPSPAESPQPSEESPQPSALPSAVPSATPAGPRLTVSTDTLDINPAQQRVISVSGASAPLVATLERKLVTVAVDPNATSVAVTATQATGNDVLHLVDANGARADVAIRVAFNAGTIVPQTTLRITGNPVDPVWLLRLVQALVARLTQAQPGTQTAFGSVAAPATPPPPGTQSQFTIPIQIGGNDQFFDTSGSTVVNVQNVPVDRFAPALLFYDDDPEHVSQDGVLFRGTVTAADPARLYYYHDNAADSRRIVVALTSQSQDPTSVQLIDASAGPNVDVMQVGHAVTREFMLTKARGQGIVADLSPDEPFALHDVAMSPRQGVAGNVDVRVLAGGPVTVTVLAVSAGVDPRTLLAQPVLPDDGHHRNGVFRLTGFGSDALSFTTGGPEAKLVIGDREPSVPNVDPNATGHDYGDYGVLHSIDLTMTNSSDAPATAFLYFRPIAGIARASFLIDGNLLELGCVRQPVPYQISSFALAPRQVSHVAVQTMTDGGSFYPVEIGVTTTPPQPFAPPISAPDGCFPKAIPAPAAAPEPAPAPTAAPTPVATPS